MKQRIEEVAEHLATRGAIVTKQNGRRKTWVLRFRLVEGGRRKLRSVHICSEHELELLARTRSLLNSIQGPARWCREIISYARCSRAACSLVKRLTGK